MRGFLPLPGSREKKFIEAVHGLHDLLDLFTREVITRIPKFNKTTPREEMERQFDNIGKDFQNKLRLKGITGWISSIVFWVILKALKILFLDSVAEELLKNPSGEITSQRHRTRRPPGECGNYFSADNRYSGVTANRQRDFHAPDFLHSVFYFLVDLK